MKRTQSNDQRESYEPSGRELRIYWDERPETHDDGIGGVINGYSYLEAVLPISATNAEIVEGIASIDADADAAALADGWFASGLPDLIPLRFRTIAVPVSNQSLAEQLADALGYGGSWADARSKGGQITHIMTAGWMPPEMVWSDPTITWRHATDAGMSVSAEEIVDLFASSDISDDAPLAVSNRIKAWATDVSL